MILRPLILIYEHENIYAVSCHGRVVSVWQYGERGWGGASPTRLECDLIFSHDDGLPNDDHLHQQGQAKGHDITVGNQMDRIVGLTMSRFI